MDQRYSNENARRIGRSTAVAVMAAGVLGVFPGGPARADAVCGLSTNCVTMWNETLVSLIRQTSVLTIDGPPEVANQIAILGTSMFNAVNSATGETYKSYSSNIGAVANADANAAALAAGYSALMGMFAPAGAPGNPSASPNTFGNLLATLAPNQGSLAVSNAVVAQINNTYTAALANLNQLNPTVQNGLALGSTAASNIVNTRNADGAYASMVSGLTPMASGVGAGAYTVPLNPARPAMYPTWGTVTPWTMTSSTQFDPGAPLGHALGGGTDYVGLLADPLYKASILKTECLGGINAPVGVTCGVYALPANNGKVNSLAITAPIVSNANVALFWNDPGTTLQPPGHWLQITDTAIANNGTDLLGSARISAQVGVAMADAGIAAWQSKYDYLLWRPQDAIRCGIAWGYANCDATWSSLIATPPHPDYVAGHPAFSTSAADLLQNFFGTGTSDDFCTSSDAYNNGPGNPIGAMTLCYNSFTAAADDATLSRIYGGIHTDIASNASALIGHQIASQILTNDFPVPEPGTLGLLGVGLAGAAALRRRRQAALWCTGSG